MGLHSLIFLLCPWCDLIRHSWKYPMWLLAGDGGGRARTHSTFYKGQREIWSRLVP